MIELLLQAERALSAGHVDQAERLYAQAAAADPRSSIAVVGLARVALEREDDAAAYRLARQALGIDPENVAAARLVGRLEEVYARRGLPVPGSLAAGDREASVAEAGEAHAPEPAAVRAEDLDAPQVGDLDAPQVGDLDAPPAEGVTMAEDAGAATAPPADGSTTEAGRAGEAAAVPSEEVAGLPAPVSDDDPAPAPPAPRVRHEPDAPAVHRSLLDRLLGRNQP